MTTDLREPRKGQRKPAALLLFLPFKYHSHSAESEVSTGMNYIWSLRDYIRTDSAKEPAYACCGDFPFLGAKRKTKIIDYLPRFRIIILTVTLRYAK